MKALATLGAIAGCAYLCATSACGAPPWTLDRMLIFAAALALWVTT